MNRGERLIKLRDIWFSVKAVYAARVRQRRWQVEDGFSKGMSQCTAPRSTPKEVIGCESRQTLAAKC